MGGEGGDGVFSPVPQQILGQLSLFLRDGCIPLEQFRVDDGHVQTGLHAMVKEDRIENFTSRRRQTEGHVGDSQNCLGLGQGFFYQANALNGLDAGADVVLVAGAGGEDQRVEIDVFNRNMVFFGENLGRSQSNLQLALTSDCLGLFLIFVDAAHHQRCAVTAGQGYDGLEAGLSVFQVHRVDD